MLIILMQFKMNKIFEDFEAWKYFVLFIKTVITFHDYSLVSKKMEKLKKPCRLSKKISFSHCLIFLYICRAHCMHKSLLVVKIRALF